MPISIVTMVTLPDKATMIGDRPTAIKPVRIAKGGDP